MTLEENLLHRDTSEKSILGAIDVDNSKIDEVSKIIKPYMFSKQENRLVYEAMLKLRDSGTDINVSTIFQELVKAGKTESVPAYLVSECVPHTSPDQAMYFAATVADTYIKEQVKMISERLQRKASTDSSDGFELIEASVKALEEITSDINGEEGMSSLADVIDEMMVDMDEEIIDGISGVPSGINTVDELTSGWQRGNLIIIAGRPAMGKSAFVTTMMNNAAMQGYPVALFSMEMTKREVGGRLSAVHTRLSYADINKRRLYNDQKEFFKETQKSFRNLPIYIGDTSYLTLSSLKSQARNLVKKKGVKMIVIDYLQLMKGDGKQDSREQEVSTFTRELKNLAKELDIPIIALSQLSRAVENRDSPRPQLSDLRESGGIEQDANVVAFLYRPEYYAQQKGEEVHPDDKGLAQLIFSKGRDGELGTLDLEFIGEYGYFGDLNRKL